MSTKKLVKLGKNTPDGGKMPRMRMITLYLGKGRHKRKVWAVEVLNSFTPESNETFSIEIAEAVYG